MQCVLGDHVPPGSPQREQTGDRGMVVTGMGTGGREGTDGVSVGSNLNLAEEVEGMPQPAPEGQVGLLAF